MATVEVLGATLCLTNPRHRLVDLPPVRVLNPAFAAAEMTWVLSGSGDPWIFQYNRRLADYADHGRLMGAYGPRLRRWHGAIDQLARVRELLAADPDTRRAVVQLFDPDADFRGYKDVPCTLGYHFFLRDGLLQMHTTMRSQDLWLGFCYDIFTATVIQERLAGWLDAEIGAKWRRCWPDQSRTMTRLPCRALPTWPCGAAGCPRRGRSTVLPPSGGICSRRWTPPRWRTCGAPEWKRPNCSGAGSPPDLCLLGRSIATGM